MKKYFLYNVAVAVLSAVILTGCSDDNDETAVEKQTKLLLAGKPWVIESIKVNNNDKTAMFPDLKLTFAEATFAAQNGEPVWPASDTWSFTDDTATRLTRGDEVEVSIESLTKTTLVLKMHWEETTIGGRIQSVEGDHVFTFSH